MPILSEAPALPVARVAMIARWKPVHLGHAAVLEGLVAAGREVWVGIGSSNKHDADNPFTPEETAAMIRAVIGEPPHVRIFEVPDLGDPPRWAAGLAKTLGDLDLYVTANDLVRDLFAPIWPVLHPVHLVPRGQRIALDGAFVRRAMLRGEAWRDLVPPAVRQVLDDRGLVARFRAEFRPGR